MANVIKIKRGTNVPTARQYNVYVYDSNYDANKTYYNLSGSLYPYELGYRTDQGGGRIYLNDNNTVVQIGRKIFVQGTEPTSAQSVEGDLWVDTSSL